jgi:hypothetical protein
MPVFGLSGTLNLRLITVTSVSVEKVSELILVDEVRVRL